MESGCVMGCLKGFIQSQKAGALSTDIDSGCESQHHFPNKNRYIAPKHSIYDSTANDRRYTTKHQNTQLSAHIHLHFLLSTFIAQVQRNYALDDYRELVLNISNNAQLSKGKYLFLLAILLIFYRSNTSYFYGSRNEDSRGPWPLLSTDNKQNKPQNWQQRIMRITVPQS